MSNTTPIITSFRILLPPGEAPESDVEAGRTGGPEDDEGVEEAAEVARCDTGVPHCSQKLVAASIGEPHFVQNCCAAAESVERTRRAPHLVQNESVAAKRAPQFPQLTLTSLVISSPLFP